MEDYMLQIIIQGTTFMKIEANAFRHLMHLRDYLHKCANSFTFLKWISTATVVFENISTLLINYNGNWQVSLCRICTGNYSLMRGHVYLRYNNHMKNMDYVLIYV